MPRAPTVHAVDSESIGQRGLPSKMGALTWPPEMDP
jgi:hypothetical protein